jgi:hypothetical protein
MPISKLFIPDRELLLWLQPRVVLEVKAPDCDRASPSDTPHKSKLPKDQRMVAEKQNIWELNTFFTSNSTWIFLGI